MPDFDEPVGQNMEEEPPDKLVGIHRHDLLFVVVGVVPPPEGNLVVRYFHDPMIADRDSVGVSAENAHWATEGRFAVDDPLLLVQVGDEGIETPRRRKTAYDAGVNDFILRTELFQIGDELTLKELRHDLDWKEKVLFAGFPVPSAPGQSSSGNDVVDMGMIHEILSPGVQNADKSDLGSKAFLV